MSIRPRFRATRRAAGIGLVALAAAVALPAPQASAQGLLEALFGGLRRASQQIHLPSSATPFADPFGFGGERRRPAGDHHVGGGQAYCVRTCDGRFFPLQRQGSTSPAELCKSFCPASQTQVFYGGGKIDHAVSGGTRYSDLQNAFVFRERVVENCTCNGRDAFGLARVDVADDPTLKPGDIVATNEGLATYRGRDRTKAAQFTPINPNAGEWARRLSQTEVRPAPTTPTVETIEPVTDQTGSVTPRERRNVSRSVQLSR